MKPEVHICLLHYPVVNKAGDVVATAVTNLDIHDNARSARTFGVKSYHVVTPLDAQIELVSRIVAHWQDGFGATRIPSRVSAMSLIQISRDLEEAIEKIVDGRDVQPVVISTCARDMGQEYTYRQMRERIKQSPEGPYIILFGTGYGLANEVLDRSDVLLEPIGSPTEWNHLSVRSAVAITLDRLLSDY
ncbi:MAG: RNA methyltransferase [Deltaproteobacteria bacterium]|nr:RNA methyltransferase [Deltaproteobacteria bacterium]MBN2670414.1 RNA methyltransferase [Deltaproteobacteria bacterium]